MNNLNGIGGRKYNGFVINEAGFVPDLLNIWGYIIRHTLVDWEGDAFFGGTPSGRNGFWTMFEWGQDPLNNEWKSWKMSSYENPCIPRSEIDEMVRSLPELVVKQEIYAEFLEGQGIVFRNIKACMNAKPTTPEAHKGHNIVAGLDWGKQNDFSATSIGCADCKYELAIDRFNQIDYVFQVERLAGLVDKWGHVTVHAETNSMGEAVIEQVERRGIRVIPFTTTARTKGPLIEDLALAIERKEIAFQNIPVMIGELQAYTMTLSKYTGRPQYSAPDGMNDDTVMSLALMWHGMRRAMGGELLAFV